MKQKITLEERKKIQLEMLVEIDKFCREHNIKYMLAFGTLLGAIRHKGYIPWDDDVDISMPLEDMLRFKKEFKSDKLKYCDVDTEPNYAFPFSRIAHKQTYSKCGMIAKSYGVCIDLYPTIEVSSLMEDNQAIVNRLLPIYRKRLRMIVWRSRIMKLIPIRSVVGFESIVRKYRDMTFNLFTKKGGGAFHCIAGPLTSFDVHTFAFNPFDEMIEVDFEGLKFMAPAKYHEYLSTRYGDYMQLPPENQRVPYHGGESYWKR
ncbi:MAG: LicD family protein [Rikenellaceae bacterium]|nr:LicD family protein [Rikenellaceae bacterium]